MTGHTPPDLLTAKALLVKAGGGLLMLASVADANEARIAVTGGADIIDAKDPVRGALGALDTPTLERIRDAVPRSIPLSATTGDIPASETARIVNEIHRVAAAGVDAVKIGLFARRVPQELLTELTRHTSDDSAFGRRVAVLLADRNPCWDVVDHLRAAGFSGVMLDTADKASGCLFDVVSNERIAGFIAAARHAGLFAGLAGALRLRHIPEVTALAPDVVGFRGALCSGQQRNATIDARAVREVRAALQRAGTAKAAVSVASLPA